jgi:hypothetical protein
MHPLLIEQLAKYGSNIRYHSWNKPNPIKGILYIIVIIIPISLEIWAIDSASSFLYDKCRELILPIFIFVFYCILLPIFVISGREPNPHMASDAIPLGRLILRCYIPFFFSINFAYHPCTELATTSE